MADCDTKQITRDEITAFHGVVPKNDCQMFLLRSILGALWTWTPILRETSGLGSSAPAGLCGPTELAGLKDMSGCRCMMGGIFPKTPACCAPNCAESARAAP